MTPPRSSPPPAPSTRRCSSAASTPRPARPDAALDALTPGRVRGQPGASPQRRHRPRRRRVPRRPGRGEGGDLPRLGGPPAPVRRGAARHRRAARPSGCSTCSPGNWACASVSATPRVPAPNSTPSAIRTAPTCRTRTYPADPPPTPRTRRGGARVVADAAGRGPDAGRRAAPRGHGTTPRSPACLAATAAEIGAADGDPVTVSTERGAITLPSRGHRDARSSGVAAAELAGRRGLSAPGRDRAAPSGRPWSGSRTGWRPGHPG